MKKDEILKENGILKKEALNKNIRAVY